MHTDDLIREFGDQLREMPHERYARIVSEACGDNPATESAIRLARAKPESRFHNIARDRVLNRLRQQATGQRLDCDTSGLELF